MPHRRSRSLTIVQTHYPGVTAVKDGRMDVEIEVTKPDIAKARKADHGSCVVALACARAVKADGMVVSIDTAYVIKGRTATRYKVPPSVSREITAFDRGAHFAEGTYCLKAPCASIRLGAPQQAQGGHSRVSTGTGAKPPRHLTQEIRTVLSGRPRRAPQ